jgi:hypothetical protein
MPRVEPTTKPIVGSTEQVSVPAVRRGAVGKLRASAEATATVDKSMAITVERMGVLL